MFQKNPKIEAKTGLKKIFTRERLNQSLRPEILFKTPKNNEPIFQLAYDIARNHFEINGTSIEKSLVEQATKYTENPNDAEIKGVFISTFNKSLKDKGFPQEIIEKLLKHYSQRPSYGTSKIRELMQDGPNFISSHSDRHILSFKNGKVYFDSISTGLFIKDPFDSSKHLRDFKGTIESQFELTVEGFDLVSFSADGDCDPLLDRKLLDKERVAEQINHITDALKKNDLKLFIYHLYTFQKYLDETLLKIYPHMKPEAIQMWMNDKFSQEIKENHIPSEKTFLAVQEMLAEIKYGLAGEKNGKKFEDLIRIENAFYTYFEVLERKGISKDANIYADDEQYERYVETHKPNMEKYIEEAVMKYYAMGLLYQKNMEKYIAEVMIKYDTRESLYQKNIEKHIEDAVIKYYAMELSFPNALKIIEQSYEEKYGERIKRKFCKYQIEHAREIYNKQFQQAVLSEQRRILDELPTDQDFLNKGNVTTDTGHQEHDDTSPSKDEYLEKTVLNEAKKRVGGTIAYNFLVNIEDTILNTTWNVGTVGGTFVHDTSGRLITKVPKNMVKILAIIEDAKKNDATGKSTEWITALNQVALIGAKAAHKVSLFRDEKTQDFYDTFVIAFNNIRESNLPATEEETMSRLYLNI